MSTYSCNMVNEYYSWLMDIIYLDENFNGTNYSVALGILMSREFTWTVKNDDNRAADGLELRDIFAYENRYPLDFWEGYLPDYCSVLEMMVALARRCEYEIMRDPDYGDRTAYWFWIMVENLGLNVFTDEIFYDDEVKNRVEIERILDIFLGRKYGKDGVGNIFCVKNFAGNMSKMEIWYQLQYYLEDKY